MSTKPNDSIGHSHDHDADVVAGRRGRGVLAEGDLGVRATWRMPFRMVLPGMMSPDRPCQATVQPPAWLPMSSALLPAT